MVIYCRIGDGMKSPKLIIIGRIEKCNLSGPGTVVHSLLSGLDRIGISYTFINTYNISFLRLGALLLKILFVRGAIVNVHTFGYRIPHFIMIISRINKSNKYYLTVHGVNSYEYRINGMIDEAARIEQVESELLRKFPNVICVSRFLRDFIANKFKRRSSIYYAYNCVEAGDKEVPHKNSKHTFLYTGGFSNRKNPLGAINFFRNICLVQNKDAKLIMCGNKIDDDLYRECKEFILSHNLKESIVVLGEMDKKQLARYYAEATFIIAPSVFDTFNMSVLEAMSFGCIPIVSDRCGIKDIINDENGYIIEKIGENKNIYADIKIISRKAFDTALQLSPESMAKNYVSIWGI